MASIPRINWIVFIYYCVIITCINSDKGVGGVPASARRPVLSSYSLSDILDDLDLHSDNRIRPGYGERVLEIHAFAYLRNIIEINEEDSTITVNLLFMQIWEDPRVSFSPVILNNGGGGGGVREILIDNPDFMRRLWNPDTFIVNEVKAHVCTGGTNLAHQIIRLGHTGTILKTTSRLTVTVSCPMRHKNYPFHDFECDIELESFGHKRDDIVFMWRNGSKSVDYSKIDRTSLAGRSSYVLKSVESHSQQTYLDTGGSYSKLIIRLHFSKLWLRHAITFFIPTVVLTIISLGSLWVLENAATGVITNFIIAGLVVLLAGVEYSVASLLTQVPFLTPVDIHLGICLCTIFSSVAFHGISLCLHSKCFGRRPPIFEGSQSLFTQASRKKPDFEGLKSTKSESDDATVETDTKKFIPAKDAKSDNNEVSYYESYDEALEGEAGTGADDEGHYKFRQRAEVLEGEGQRHHHEKNPVASSNFEGGANNGKMSSPDSQRKKTMKRFFAGLVSSSLTLSRWITLCSFVLTESIFWYSYLAVD